LRHLGTRLNMLLLLLLATTKHSFCLNFDQKQFSKLLMSSPLVQNREQEEVGTEGATGAKHVKCLRGQVLNVLYTLVAKLDCNKLAIHTHTHTHT